jgi:glucose/arabinose dehydrogenase
MMRSARSHVVYAGSMALALGLGMSMHNPAAQEQPAKAAAPFSDYRDERAGTVHKIAVADLPAPFASQSVNNGPRLVPRPEGALPQGLPGYTITQFAGELDNPRLIRTAPNGDLFVVESRPGRLKVLRGLGPDGKAQTVETFATGLNRPFGVAFYPSGSNPQFVYVANTDSVVRFPYKSGDLKASGAQEVIVPALPEGGQLRGGGHWTRDVLFSRDGKKMFVSVGSFSNIDDSDNNPVEKDRANILEFSPDGKGLRVYASGIRNPVGITLHPRTGQIWTAVNERDGLGDNLVPDYITHVEEGGFYGWPWFYMGGHQDPRHEGKHPELKAKVKTPDILLQPHSAPLGLVFYTATQFPSEHRDSIFAAAHGSWNKSVRTGYKVIRAPLKGGTPTGEYQDFVTGFVTADGQVWGRPTGVAVANDGALLVSDDGSNSIWRVAYGGKK